MASKKRGMSLADKISSLVTAAPTNFDSDDDNEDTRAKLVVPDDETDDTEDDVRVSKFRKQNVDLLDETDKRYEGKKISRKETRGESYSEGSGEDPDSNDSEDDPEKSEDEAEGDSGSGGHLSDREEVSGDESSGSDEEKMDQESNSDVEDDSEVDDSNPLRRNAKSELNFKHMSDINVRAEVEKGNCVRNQLNVWESLLEMRIKLQKCLVSGNRMPQFDAFKELKSDKTFLKNTNDAKSKLTGLLDNLLKLQSTLLKNYPETKNLHKDNEKTRETEASNEDHTDEEIPSDTEDEMDKSASDVEKSEEENEEDEATPRKKLKFSEYEKVLAENHKSYSNYRNSVIQKWNDKTRVAVGKVNKGSNQSVVKQIDFILSDKIKLLARTRLKRSEYEIIGKSNENQEDEDGRRVQEYDPEIYDDDDFYHQLLRELIEFKSADVTDPIQLSKQWIQLQNMRSKMKRKIDTKATKGRRIRYSVHTKLVNFMAPIPVNDLWADEAKSELYSSLFGRIKETETK